MRKSSSRRISAVAQSGVALAAILALAWSPGGLAQTVPAGDPNKPDQAAADPEGRTQIQSGDEQTVARSAADQGVAKNEIVVTGTLLRGAPPVGSNLISIGEDRIQSQGASSTNELLATIPQVSNFFNTVPTRDLAGATNVIQASTPNLRRLSRADSATQATLTLMDGHRIAGVGVTQNIVDPDLIPPPAIERVEIVTDGGSATYGTDAVAGVVNFITRKRFDGVKVDARYGFAGDYWQVDANALVGKDWGSGSLYLAYSFKKNSRLFGRDRDFVQNLDYSFSPPRPTSTTCLQPNITIGSGASAVTYAAPAYTAGQPNRCDSSDDSTIVPALERHGGLISLFQQLNDSISINLRGFYSERQTHAGSAPTFRGNVTSSNFYYLVPSGVAGQPTEAVEFSFAPVIPTIPNDTSIKEWGVNAELKANLNDNFQLRTLFNYSRSHSRVVTVSGDTTAINAALAGSTAATAINPYNIGATQNLDLVRSLFGFAAQREGRDELLNLRAIIDGKLFTLPGGDVKLAVGYEYLHDGFRNRQTGGAALGTLETLPFNVYRRQVHALFAEAQVPIFGEGNRVPGIYSVVISGAVRYDHYSDFGGTTNPKIGVNYKPVSWLNLRGNWGTSFNAPSPVDQLGAKAPTILAIPIAAFVRPGDAIPGGIFNAATVAIQGANTPLQPQTATTWSVGVDIDPPFLTGFRASVSYYDVNFKNILATPTPNSGIFANFPNNVLTRLPTALRVGGFTPAEVRAFIAPFAAGDPAGAANTENLLTAANPVPVYLLVDFRTGNYGNRHVKGLDFSTSYRMATGFGGLDASIAGDYALSRKSSPAVGAPEIDELTGIAGGVRQQDAAPRLLLQATIGADVGHFRAQATLNHTSGIDILPLVTDVAPQQTHGSAFDTVNLFFKYDVPGESLLVKDLSLTVNIQNAFDTSPPELRRTTANGVGSTNGFTIGRIIMLGASKKF